MGGYGTAVLRRGEHGRVEIVQADDLIGISVELLADPDAQLYVDSEGLLWLAGDPAYRYRPVRFEPAIGGLGPGQAAPGSRVLICQRVR